MIRRHRAIRYHHARQLVGDNRGRAYWGWCIIIGGLIMFAIVRWGVPALWEAMGS